MPAKVAGVELLNVVRPTVAVAWFVTWAGLRLAEHPEWRARVREDEAALDAFVQEVRRLHPFVPVLAAKARARQDVLGHPLRRGGLVVLDVHGTDHDPVLWPDPDAFRPERFLDGQVERDALVPQGGGDVVSGHRCPGEQVTMVMLQVAVARLARVAYSMPEQDLTVDMTRMPTLPRSGVVIEVADIPS
jgi:fatty-acid peroxygenase